MPKAPANTSPTWTATSASLRSHHQARKEFAAGTSDGPQTDRPTTTPVTTSRASKTIQDVSLRGIASPPYRFRQADGYDEQDADEPGPHAELKSTSIGCV